MYSKKTDPYQD